MAGIPGIRRQPAFQALPGRITQVLDHLGHGHRRGGIQVHRAPSFFRTEHTIILSFSLQENVRTLLIYINTMMPNDDVPEAPIILAITVPPREIRTANTRVGRTDFWYANCRRDAERRMTKAIRYEAPPFVSSSDSALA